MNNQAFVLVYPHDQSHTSEIKSALSVQSLGKNYTVFDRANIPARWHYSHSPRIPDIVLLADPGWVFGDNPWDGGAHGYDPTYPDMHAIFSGYGPSFPRGMSIPSFENVEVYEFLCGLMKITPYQSHNSTGLLQKLIYQKLY